MSQSRPPPPFPLEVHFEIVKLLLQVAWADDEVAPEEQDSLLRYAQTVGLSAEQQLQIRSCLAGQEPLPPPNLGVLKSHRVEVLRRVRELLMADHDVSDEEHGVLAEISLLLR